MFKATLRYTKDNETVEETRHGATERAALDYIYKVAGYTTKIENIIHIKTESMSI